MFSWTDRDWFNNLIDNWLIVSKQWDGSSNVMMYIIMLQTIMTKMEAPCAGLIQWCALSLCYQPLWLQWQPSIYRLIGSFTATTATRVTWQYLLRIFLLQPLMQDNTLEQTRTINSYLPIPWKKPCTALPNPQPSSNTDTSLLVICTHCTYEPFNSAFNPCSKTGVLSHGVSFQSF